MLEIFYVPVELKLSNFLRVFCRTESKLSQKLDSGGPSRPYPQLFRSISQVTDLIPFSRNRPYENARLLHEKYVVQGLSLIQIAREFFCSKNTVRSALIRAGVPLRGRQMTGRPSNPRYGTRAAKGYHVNHGPELRVTKTVLEMRNDGISFLKIAKFLSGAGVPTKTRRKKWHPEVVRQIYLQNS